MKNDFNQSDKRLQEKLEGFQMTAPEGAWAGIESNVSGSTGGKKRFFYLWIVLLFIGLTSGGIFTFLHFYGNENVSPSNQKIDLQTNAQSSKKAYTTTKQNNETANFAAAQKDSIEFKKTTQNTNDEINARYLAGPFDSNEKGTQVPQRQSDAVEFSTLEPDTDTHWRNERAKPDFTDPEGRLSSNKADKDFTPVFTKRDTYIKGAIENAKNETEAMNLNVLAYRSIAPIYASNSELFETKSSFDPTMKPKALWSIEFGADISSFNYNHKFTNDSLNAQTFLNNSYKQTFGQGGFFSVNFQPFQYASFHAGIDFYQEQSSQEFTTTTTTSTVQYDTIGYYFDSITQQQLPIVDTSTQINSTDELNTLNHSISQVKIPIGVMFHIPVGLRSEFGVKLSGIIGYRTKGTGNLLLDSNGNSVAISDAFKRFNFTARAAFRYSYRVNERATVYAEPYLGFGLNNRSNATIPFSSRFRNSGLRIGFRYNF